MNVVTIIEKFKKKNVCPLDGPFHQCKHHFDFSQYDRIIAPVFRAIEKATAAAFGGCTRCYGKGYSTVITGYSDESTGNRWSETELLYCGCNRGAALQIEINRIKLKQQAVYERRAI